MTTLLFFNKIFFAFIFFVAMLYAKTVLSASEDHNEHKHAHNGQQDSHQHDASHDDHGHDDEHEHHEEEGSHIDEAMAKQVGIITERSRSQTLHQKIITYGRLTSPPEKTSHVRARFSGVITSVNATIGDTVAEGDLLAEVESNESLKKYRIRAPISGTIIQRHANAGEVTQEQILFSISSFESVWAELRIFPSLRAAVFAGQDVDIIINNQTSSAIVEHILPVSDNHPYVVARAKIHNATALLSPGAMVEGHIVVGRFTVDVAVKKIALQTMDERTGIFVKHDTEYKFIPLLLGRQDDNYVEVLSGLQSGTEYVTQNSYLIKADIQKSEAEHEH